jgi:nucleoside-diphosphate-sugar epimerase
LAEEHHSSSAEKNASLVLVTGATGMVGPRVVVALLDAGYRVRTLSLDAPQPGLLPEGVDIQTGDVTDSLAVRAAMQGVNEVIHMAALLHIVEPLSSLQEMYQRVNVGGTATVVEAAASEGVKRLVFFSTIAVYGDACQQILTEDSVPHPDIFYAQTKLAAEQIVLNATRSDGQPLGVVLRLGAVYGSRIKGNYQRLVQALARGCFIQVGDGHNRRTLIYDKDVARAAVLAVCHPAAAGRIYNVSDGSFHTMREIVETICAALGRTLPRLTLPAGAARTAGSVLEDIARMAGHKSSIGRATVDKYIEDIAVSSQRIQSELGFVPQFDLAQGWQETVQEMRQAGDLMNPHA